MRIALLMIALSYMPSLSPAWSQSSARGILGREAPAWGVTEWINLPSGQTKLDLEDYRGKVVYLYGFQSWCPGCHSHGFPTLKTLIKHYGESESNKDVVFVAVQTVFEGFSTNTAQAARRIADRYDLKIPVGHDSPNGRRSVIMNRYRTGGTPWTIIIDKQGVVRYNDFHIDPQKAIAIMDRLRAAPGPRPDPEQKSRTRAGKNKESFPTLPPARGGQDRIGKSFPEMHFDASHTAQSPSPARMDRAKSAVTLYRWWTDGCSFCRNSLPALEVLRKKYEKDGLRTVCVYHPKPPKEVKLKAVRSIARAMGYQGEIAIDEDWSELERAYLDSGNRRATSVTFLVDRQGEIRFLHPGPVFFPSDDPRFEEENRDYRKLDRAIQMLLQKDALPAPSTSPAREKEAAALP